MSFIVVRSELLLFGTLFFGLFKLLKLVICGKLGMVLESDFDRIFGLVIKVCGTVLASLCCSQ